MHQNTDMPVYPPIQPNVKEGLIQVIAARLDNLHSDVSGMRDVLKELAIAVNKMAIIEERQGQAAQSLERAFLALEKVEIRVAAIEKAQPMQQQSADWINKAMWAGACLIAVFVAKKVGLM